MPERPRPRLTAATGSMAMVVLVASLVTAAVRLTASSGRARARGQPPAKLDITNPTVTVATVPAAGQVTVTGTVTLLRADDAVAGPIRLPVTITVPTRGQGGMTISNVLVGGRPASVGWDAGQPLPLSGSGAIDLGPASVDADASGITWYLDGAPRVLTAGRDMAGAPVAIGSGGLPQPSDSATFDAGAGSGFVTAGGARIHLPPAPLRLQGPGHVHLSGDLSVEDPTGAVRHVATVTFGPGPFVLDLTPAPGGHGGYTVTAHLQGPVTAI